LEEVEKEGENVEDVVEIKKCSLGHYFTKTGEDFF
jgi:hypothetical protein